MLSSRDNWERLVAAVLKREQFLQLCFQHSRTPSVSTVSSDSTSDFTQEILNLSGYSFSLELRNSVAPPSPFPLENPSVSQVSNKASPQPITRKLFSALYRRRKPKGKHLADISEAVPIHLGRVRRFSIHELRAATDNFSNKIGLGPGHGITYKGRLADGSLVAVKRYISGLGSKNGFQTELEINSIAVHRNVLHVLGICITPKEQMLIYPLMVNGSIASRIRDRQESLPPLDWPTRKQIALGTARGLAYMHHECHVKIIHRDVKAVNILLDEDFEAVIAHFNLAKLMDFNDTDVLTAVRGTIGHIAPEYLSTGKCSEKTDVFGYGVFLLELITGQRAFDLARLDNEDDAMLLDRVKKNYKERKLEMMVDADCGGNYMEELVEQLIQMALLCTASAPEKRPKMSEVVRMLEVDDVSVIEQYKEEMFPQEIQKHWNEEEMVDEAVLTASYMFDDDIPIFPR